jgi:hypothetical protein
VPAAVQDKVLEVCARHLAPDGVAYVSYNTYPGTTSTSRRGGRFDGLKGPFRGKGDWDRPPHPHVPDPVGEEGLRDESPFGCRGMAANGQEPTTDVSLHPQLFFPNIAAGGADHDLVLRGAPAGDRQPFQFKALEDAVTPRNPGRTGSPPRRSASGSWSSRPRSPPAQ